MVPLMRAASVAGALVVAAALASTGIAQHPHGPHTHQPAGHADCDVCHFRHLPVIETDSAPAPSAPDLVAHAVPSDGPKGARSEVVGIRPTRGPPA